MPNVVIVSAAGDQNRAIAERFVAAGWRVTGLTRDPAREALIREVGAEPVTVDPADDAGLEAALGGHDVIVFTSPADYRDGVRETLASRFAKAARRAAIRRAVVNTAAAVIPASGPNAGSLRAVADAFADALPETVVLEPTVYLDNISAPWMINKAITADTLFYPQPAHAHLSWLTHRTLGDFAVAGATRDDAIGQRFEIGGSEAFDGAALAAAFSRAVGRPLRYQPLPLDAFAANLNATFGPPAGDRIAENFRWLEDHPNAMRVDGTAATRLNVKPEPFDDWAARQAWPSP